MKNKRRFLARMGARGSLGQALLELADEGKYFFYTSADLAHASGFDRLMQKYPERFANTGIAEQNLIGVAAGLSADGTPTVATTWAMFASVRVADQVRNLLGYMQRNVKLVGMDSGLVQAPFGNSHCNPPDLAIMRAIPGLTIISPADGVEICAAVRAAMAHEGPVYIRLTGGNLLPMIYDKDEISFEIGKSVVLQSGSKVAFVGCGVILDNVLKAAKLLEQDGITAEVVNMHTVVPLDTRCLNRLANFDMVVTVEEHLLSGGLGSAIAEYYACLEKRPRQIMLGIDNRNIQPGTVDYVREQNGLQPEQIATKVLENIH